jgi:hypothetical protein
MGKRIRYVGLDVHAAHAAFIRSAQRAFVRCNS